MSYQEVRYDIADDFSWQIITDTFSDAGELLSRETQYDSGFRAIATYLNGVRTSLVQYDEIGGGTGLGASWSTISSTYDASGLLSSRVTEFDDGTQRIEQYFAGTRTQTIETDNSIGGAAANWEQILTTYDINGALSFRTAYFDDGVIREERFDAGVRIEQSELDVADARDWNAIRTFYDASGALDFRRTQNDDRTVKEEDWDNGSIVSIAQYDQSLNGAAAVWQSVVAIYDGAGELASKRTVFDNGLIREETFANGQRVSLTETDSNDLFGTGVKNWSSITTIYDAAGDIAERVTVQDNGIIKTETLDGGQRVSTMSVDADDRAHWDTIEFIFDDNGRVEVRTDVFDNGDLTINVYDNGARELRIEFDGDGDRPWEVRVADYTTGQVIGYDSLGDAPASIQDYFDFVV